MPDFEKKFPYQSIGQEYLDEVTALYNRTHAGSTGTAVRPTYRRIPQDESSPIFGWVDQEGNLSGYLRVIPADDKKSLQCLEISGDPVQAIAILKDLFTEGGYETLNFFTLHHQHPVLQILRKGSCVVEDRYFYNSGWRVKIINLQSTLEALQPLLVERLEKSHLRNWCGQLHIDAGEQKANLSLQSGAIEVQAPSPADHMIQGDAAIGRFLIGSDKPQEIVQQDGVQCTGDAIELVETLFPNLYPMLSHWDEF